MKRLLTKGMLVGAAVTVGAAGFGGTAYATSQMGAYRHGNSDNGVEMREFTAQLDPLNNSGAYGTAHISVTGRQATVTIDSKGTSPELPHAQHFHISTSGNNTSCPGISSDMDGDGLISTVEGLPSYGPIKVSLTTEGDTSADSGLAVDRFPVSNENGELSYSRTFTLPQDVSADDLKNAEIVQHGVSKLFGDPNAYDGEPRSSLTPTLPLEATIPANCGVLQENTGTMPGDDGKEHNVPMAGMDANKATTTFTGRVDALLNELQSQGADPAAVAAFRADYQAASGAFAERLQAASDEYDRTTEGNLEVAKNRYIDAYNNAKAEYLNSLDAAKNELAATLSNQGGNANELKDMFMNGYNTAHDVFGNDLEVIKNDFARRVAEAS